MKTFNEIDYPLTRADAFLNFSKTKMAVTLASHVYFSLAIYGSHFFGPFRLENFETEKKGLVDLSRESMQVFLDDLVEMNGQH